MTQGKLAAYGAGLIVSLLTGAQAAKTFSPPRTGIVDFSNVFDRYQKKIDREERIQVAMDKLDTRLRELTERGEDLQAELKLLAAGEIKRQKELELYKLKLELDELQEKGVKDLNAKWRDTMRELIDEITAELRTFAEARELDLVIEKRVVADPTPKSPGFTWPIVHYSRPEIEITNEIVELLNKRYKQQP